VYGSESIHLCAEFRNLRDIDMLQIVAHALINREAGLHELVLMPPRRGFP
jgi:hypothetical protein